MSIGKRLHALRKASGMTQDEMAARLEISRSSYQHYERDERDLPSSLLLKACEMFGDDAHRLLSGQPAPLVLRKLKEIMHLLDKRVEDLDIDLREDARWRVIEKVLNDEYRFLETPGTGPVSKEDMDGLLRMLA